MSLRSLALEILRHGPAHNQLLSPLVPYLALCGDAEAETLRLPLEHHELLEHLSALRYDPTTASARLHHVRTVQEHVTEILASIRGLATQAQRAQAPVLHLRLVATPLELAMLPFELALMPPGMPGAGAPMLINPARKITLTREVRAAVRARFVWPAEVRVLFVSSRAGGEVPTRAHALALMRALRPWSGVDPKTGGLSFDDLLTVLVDPTPEEVRAAIAQGAFTHVHLLAHGRAEHTEAGDRYGLVLHGDDGQPRLLDGQRLAGVLRPTADKAPTVVTLAACDSGNPGNVLLPGASLIHLLHQTAEIPLVVGSQYPLSFRGSVMMTETLYEQLAAGRDPRLAIMDVRERLFVAAPENHDWASLVAYARVPEDFDEQMAALELERVDRRSSAANVWAWHANWEGDSPLPPGVLAASGERVHAEASSRLAVALRWQRARA
ncbi:MAG TPA: CHAT domain-containing protein, partial [Myxococcota bacterium]|nr:CHAT domain-containing protein [Myxococcota bacterium]